MEKIWLKHYPEGVPAEIHGDEYSSLVDYFQQCCQQFSALPAFVNIGAVLSYQALWEKSDRLAAYLQAMGVQKGDRVGIMMPNLLQYPVAILAILKIGGVVVNINPLYTPPELEHVLKDSGARAILVLTNFASVVEVVFKKKTVALEHIILSELEDLFPFPKNIIVHSVLHYIKRVVPPYDLPQAHRFKKIMNTVSVSSLHRVTLTHDDLAFLQYTGGTTGVSKGAMLTHGNMVANVQQTSAWLAPHVMAGKEVVMTALPLYHVFALMANCLLFLKFGTKNVLITNPRDIDGLVKVFQKESVTAMTGVNTLFSKLVNHPLFSSPGFAKNLKSLRVALGGGMAVQEAVSQKWQAITGHPLLQGYGLTEASPVVCIGRLDSTQFNASVGFPLPSTEVAILDGAGRELAVGEEGELVVRGPQVMKGYWGEAMRGETDNVLSKDGWLRTGDYFMMSPDGSLTVKDRKKDMISVSGFKVYPNEIEGVLVHCPGVLEAGVIGVPCAETGEAVKAVIVRDPHVSEPVSKETILACCHQNLVGYKVPKIIEFRDSLPKSNIGKVIRRELR